MTIPIIAKIKKPYFTKISIKCRHSFTDSGIATCDLFGNSKDMTIKHCDGTTDQDWCPINSTLNRQKLMENGKSKNQRYMQEV